MHFSNDVKQKQPKEKPFFAKRACFIQPTCVELNLCYIRRHTPNKSTQLKGEKKFSIDFKLYSWIARVINTAHNYLYTNKHTRRERPQLGNSVKCFSCNCNFIFQNLSLRIICWTTLHTFPLNLEKNHNFTLFVVRKFSFVFAMELCKWVSVFLRKILLAKSKTDHFWMTALIIGQTDNEWWCCTLCNFYLWNDGCRVYIFLSTWARERE